jgi:hypothetical protein
VLVGRWRVSASSRRRSTATAVTAPRRRPPNRILLAVSRVGGWGSGVMCLASDLFLSQPGEQMMGADGPSVAEWAGLIGCDEATSITGLN